MYIFTKDFWSYSLERILKTFAQVMIAAIVADSFMPTVADEWLKALFTAGVAAFVSLLTAVTAYSAASGSNSTPVNLSTIPEAPKPAPNQVNLFVE